MQKQHMEQIIFQKIQQLPVETVAEVLQFVAFVEFKNSKNPKASSWQQDFLMVSQWDSNETENILKASGTNAA